MSQLFTVIPMLKETAATSVAVALWNHFDIPNAVEWSLSDINCLYISLNQFEPEVIKFSEKLLLPKLLTKLIQTNVTRISSEMMKWLKYHTEKIPIVRRWCLLYSFSDIIWYPNCTIDYKQTARNLQNSKFLNEVEKFQFLCLYCLKSEIEEKRKFGNKYFGKVRFQYYPLLCYWNFYCTNRLQDLPVTGGMSIDEFMFRNNKIDNWPAKEYFFDRMNVDEQIQNAIWIVDQGKVEYQKLIILKLNQIQRNTLCMNRSLQILTNLSSDSKYFDDILPMWFEVAHIISSEDFDTFLRRLFERKINDGIIVEVWISASDTLKMHFLNIGNPEHVHKIFYLWIQTYHKNFLNFLLDTHRKIIAKIKNMPIFSYLCEHLLANNELLMLEKVLNLCFENDEQLAPIKRNLAQSESLRKLGESLILANDFFTLEQLFRLFSDVVDLDPIKEKLVSRNFFKNHCISLVKNGEIRVLYKLLNTVCSSKIKEIEKPVQDCFDSVPVDCRKKLIIGEKLPASPTFLDFYRFGVEQSIRIKYFSNYCKKLMQNNELSKLGNLLESLFPRDEEFVSFKRIFTGKRAFADHYQKLIIRGQLSALDEWLNSIFPNVEELGQFKQDLSSQKFFISHCLKLMVEDDLLNLETLFVWLYPYVTESAPIRLLLSKKKVFGDHCEKLITSGQLSTLDKLLNLIFPSVEESMLFKQNLSSKKFFTEYCLKLIVRGELQSLGTLLTLFYPSTEESIQFRRALSMKKGFNDRCRKLITSGRLSKLDELLNLIFSDVAELIQFKQDLCKEEFFIAYCLELMTEEDFKKLRALFAYFYSSIEESISFRRALSKRKVFGNQCRKLITSGQLSTLGELLNLIFLNIDESVQFKRNFSSTKFFIDYCLKLIVGGELDILETLLACFYPCIEESIPFRRGLSRQKIFDDRCRRLIISGEISKLDELLNLIFPNVDESVIFKRDLSTKNFFINHCLKLMIEGKLQKLETLFVWIYPRITDSISFKQRLRENNVFSDHCRGLIIDNQLPKLDELLNLFYSGANEAATLKKKLSNNKWFIRHCKNLINSYHLTALDELLCWCFTNNRELDQFQSNLAISNSVKEKCLSFYRDGNLENLNNLLHLLFRYRCEFINEYKQNLLLSEDGVEVCLDLATRSISILDDIIADCLPASASITDLKKKVIFSSVGISNLKKMVHKKLLADVKQYVDQFLVSGDDKTKLKKLLLDDPTKLITFLFFKCEKSVCDSEIEWWFGDETLLHQYKSNLLVDVVFMAGLEECVFQTFDFDRLSPFNRYILKENFDLGSLDRFLSWYFESPRKIKEYKVQMIKSYKDIDTISVLLKKGRQYPYFKELFNWFFENDAVEKAKFQREHKGEKITSEIILA